MAYRFIITVSVLFSTLTLFACAGSEPSPEKAGTLKPHADSELSVNDIRKAANAGNADARNKLGILYSEGRGVGQSYVQAKQWFEKAAEQGHAGAQVNLGTLYLHGLGAPQSDQMALVWFRQAAKQGDSLAFAKLGLMFTQGRGVAQDYVQAHMWYNLSAAHGERRAAESRDNLAKQMTPTQVAEAQKLAQEFEQKAPRSLQ
ncbi:hypothetical protein W02_09850 [Nitrospira sp. KM1]|uniref:tetratricopeptide repeat protein n=1 Tax=Nitrospira sp. KM1 TaxID=1936990 RepID=UPI0013A726FF|nr:tetratricopeptide repeat protein [Nitrospira sp. KM1]BCA53845.1 hypothetical protein W02_09850 [Nitrospira sp. KM1]